MANTKVWLILALATMFSLVSAQASLPLISNAFGDNMVIKANSSAQIWGWTKDDNAAVEVSIWRGGVMHQSYITISQQRFWSVGIQHPIETEPSIVKVQTVSGQSEQAVLNNVLFGYVFVCGGQSNMEMGVSAVFNASTEIALADQYPNIRVFTAGQGTTSNTTLPVFATIEQPWSVASAASIGKSEWSYFSATCWFFGRDFYDQVKAPIGLMSINWGGTYIQTWSSPDVQAKCPSDGSGGKSPNQPSLLYNAMLSPVFGMGANAILWYQGEANIGHPKTYECFFPAMIADWRSRQDPLFGWSIPFFFVQLAPYTSGINTNNYLNLPAIRQAQLSGLTQPWVSAVTAMDAGDGGDIHPRNKQIIGKRLASAMMRSMKGVYGLQGPQFISSSSTMAPGMVAVHFGGDSPLKLVSASCPSGINPLYCSAFQLQGSDGNWLSATPKLADHKTVLVSAQFPSGVTPVRVRYAYNTWPLAVLYDTNDYPAWAFDQPVQ